MGKKKGRAAKNDELFRQFAAQLKEIMEVKFPKVKPITVEHWRETHPAGVSCPSDKYYADLAQKIQEKLCGFNLPGSFPDSLYRTLAIAVAAYMEDKKSNLGVWAAFQQLYHERYGAGWLPFFDTQHSDYFTDDLNIEDVKYLVWQVCSRVNQSQDVIYSPFSMIVDEVAPVIYDMLVERFDSAPVATALRHYIRSRLASNDHVLVREIAYWLVARNPLIAVPDKEESIINDGLELGEAFAKQDITSDRSLAIYTAKSGAAWSDYTGPLGCHVALYLSKMAETEGFAATAEALRSVKKLAFRDFVVTDSDKTYLYVEDATHEKYNLLKSSFAKGFKFHGVKGLLTQIVRFGKDWNVNGICVCLHEAPVYEGERLVAGNSAVALEKTREIIDAHNGRQLLYCKTWRQVQKALGGNNDTMPEVAEYPEAENFVIYLSREEGVGVWPDVAQCFNEPGNRLFRKLRAADESLKVMTCIVPDDIVDYIVDNNLLSEAEMYASQGGDLGRRTVQENLGFLLRFYRTRAADNIDD